ncbi:hypothetical protein LY90DRAFT_696989 [Neocallimastix californiae]|uniref:N-acetyltransferase domain-containing protein n=1 Tax=Neocallimastix californiae TaxID=1754190 RepID=A0A1Y2FQL2_9FUNG|nr:hypothetical protein LY90DRAFT_696989 [Neocallimastix californiae]|eukprot:ORY85887.1 hypothetical protein LY90DRAFT_696989 [Neocallimastix californiae]
MIKEDIDIDFSTLNIYRLTYQEIKQMKKDNFQKYKDLESKIVTLGKESAKWQDLKYPITTLDILENHAEQILYIICGKDNEIIGYLKVGRKKLYLYVCIGHYLFEYVLKKENADVSNIAYDRPSKRLISFLKKFYNFSKDIPQYNNFMIFENFSF